MANTLQVKRGTRTNLPTLTAGELGFCTDTYELYIGDGAVNRLISIGTDTKPAASVAVRGKIWFVAGAAGVKDKLEVCAKTAMEVAFDSGAFQTNTFQIDPYIWAVLY